MRASNSVRICVPICERTVGAAEQRITQAGEVADLIELRLDCLDPSHTEDTRQVADLLAHTSRPTILTLRPSEQGGHRVLDEKSRLRFWSLNRPLESGFLDIELDLVTNATQLDLGKSFDWSRVICSHHDFAEVSGNLGLLYEQMARTPARILKIAVTANDVTDCLPLFGLLERARGEGREIIAIAMGLAGIVTRILGPSRGSYLTYAALDNDSATAPGQITVDELQRIYRVSKITSETQITGLVGLPVSHSISPHIHNAAFEASGFDGVYIPLEVRDIAVFMRRMVHPRSREIKWNLRGLSVTAPHKSAVMSFLDRVEPAAAEIGAVNTIVVDNDKLHGYNTDAAAFIKTLAGRVGDLRDVRCAVIGSGGVASAAVWGLKQKQTDVTVFARDTEKARVLAEKFGAAWKTLDACAIEGFDVVINATPLGTSGERENQTPATAQQLAGTRLAYDLVYNPVETRFLREARKAGCDVLSGLEMLVTQAAEQFRLWTGDEAPLEVMKEAATRAMRL